MTQRLGQGLALALLACALGAQAQVAVGEVRVKQLPEALKSIWDRTRPEMNERSSCAAAFDAGDRDRMTLQCSVYIRMAAEGQRRALARCEDKRQELGIRAPCRLVVE